MLKKTINLLILLLFFAISGVSAQEKEIHGYIDGKIVKIDSQTGRIDSVILQLDIPANFVLVDLVYDESEELYYSIANPTNNPRLISISRAGEFTEIGAFSINNGIIYSAEAISFNKKQLYISASLNGGTNQNDFYSESLLSVDIENAQCTFVTQPRTNKPFPDIDAMTFFDNELFFFDGAPPSLNFLSFYKFTFENLQPATTTGEIYAGSYIPIADFTYLNDQIYFTANYSLYSFKISENSVKKIGTTHNTNEFNNSLVSGLTAVPSCQKPIISLEEEREFCLGSTYILDASYPNSEYLWQDGSTSASIEVEESGIYSVRVTNECGSSQDCINVNFLDLPIVDLGEDRVVCPGYILTYQSSKDATTFRWSNGLEDSAIVIKKPGIYSLTVANTCGVYSDSVNINFPNLNDLFIPNIITPNNDMKNEYFVVDERIVGSSIQIYNRYGRLVYENINYKNEWSGKNLGNAIYYYQINTGCKEIIKGWIEIRR